MFQQLLEMEFQEQMMGKELWLSFLSHFVLQWILLEIFMLEMLVQLELLILQVFFEKINPKSLLDK